MPFKFFCHYTQLAILADLTFLVFIYFSIGCVFLTYQFIYYMIINQKIK